MRNIFIERYAGNLATTGSVSFLFKKDGRVSFGPGYA